MYNEPPFPDKAISDPTKILNEQNVILNKFLERQKILYFIITIVFAVLIGGIYFTASFAVDAVLLDIKENNKQIDLVSDKIDKLFLKVDSIENEQIRLSTVLIYNNNNVLTSDSEE